LAPPPLAERTVTRPSFKEEKMSVSRYALFLKRGKEVLTPKEYEKYAKGLAKQKAIIDKKHPVDIINAFCWAKTKEGQTYWEMIHERIGDVTASPPAPRHPLLSEVDFGCNNESVSKLLTLLDARYLQAK